MTAVALVLLGLWFVAALFALDGAGHLQVVTWLASPWSSALAVLLVLTAAWHAMLGLQVVIEDYVQGHGLRQAILIAMRFGLALAAVIGLLAILRIATGVAA